MKALIVNHVVKNYSEWRKVFDADAARLEKSGMSIVGVYQSVENSNHVTVVGEAPSIETINDFFADPELKSTMERAGVIGMPEIKIFNKA